jgi:isopenicillin-N epimerase
MLEDAAGRLASAGFEPVADAPSLQMASFRLPECEPDELQRRLREEFGIEVLVQAWNEQPLLRVSVAAYNTEEDLEQLDAALRQLL